MKPCNSCICDLPGRTPLALDVIINKSSEFFGFDILKKTRKREIVDARHMAVAIANKYYYFKLKETAFAFGYKNHTSVINSGSKVKDMLDVEADFKETFERLKKFIE